MHSVADWIQILLLGGLCGIGGQIARIVVGMKKAYEDAGDRTNTLRAAAAGGPVPPVKLGTVIDPWVMVVGLLSGVIAGAAAALYLNLAPNDVDSKTVLGLIAAGYSGGDFIEGLVKRYLPQN